DEELINENPESLIHFGILKRYYSGDLNTSLVYFDKAINMLKGSADYSLIINAHVNKAAVMRNLARTAEVIKEFETLSADARYADYKNKLSYHLAYALFHNSDYFEAEKLFREVINTVKKPDDKSLMASSF